MVNSVRTLLIIAACAATGFPAVAEIQLTSCQCGSGGCGEISCAPDGCGEGCNARNKSRCKQPRTARSRKCKCTDGGQCTCCNGCDCGNGRVCNPRSTWRDFGLNWTGKCGPIGRAARRGFPGARGLKYCIDSKGSGDSGWSPPARMPVNRTHTGFGSFASYGGGQYGGAPMVYQPTDTTQLGYTYAHVPTWRRNPGMIPQTPNPSAFHARFCPRDPRSGMCLDGAAGGGCYSGDCYGGGYGSGMIIDGGYPCDMGGQIIDGGMGGGYCPASCVSTTPPQKAMAAPLVAHRPELPQTQSVARPVSFKGPNIQPVRPAVQTQRQPTRRPQQQRSARRPAPKKPGGWLGLPSLSDVNF